MAIITDKYERYHATMTLVMSLNPRLSNKKILGIAEILDPLPKEIKQMNSNELLNQLDIKA